MTKFLYAKFGKIHRYAILTAEFGKCRRKVFPQRFSKVGIEVVLNLCVPTILNYNGPQLAIRRWIKLKDNKKTYEKNSERSFFGKKARAKRWLQTDVVVSVFLCAKKFRKVFQNSVQKVNSALSLVNFDAKKIKSNSAKLSTQSSAKFCAKFFGKDWVLK